MNEVAFPLLGAAFVVLVVLPCSALVAKLALLALDRFEGHSTMHGSSLRYTLLIGSSAVPLGWFMSAGLHQAESGRSALSCLLEHEKAAICLEPGFFALLLAASLGCAWYVVRRRTGEVRSASSSIALEVVHRVDSIIDSSDSLALLRDRFVVTEDEGFTLGTRGFVRPRVYVGVRFADALTDSMLASALAHELEHVRAFDPLRYLFLELALSVNPLGSVLLMPSVARWRAARETHCDREAVIHGAEPLSLADAIVRAARPVARETAPLGGNDVGVLKLRVHLLLAFADDAPARCCEPRRSAMLTPIMLLLVVLLLPHRAGTAALDAVHAGVETAISSLVH